MFINEFSNVLFGVFNRLHKIASNDKTVMSQFSKEDLGKDLTDLDIGDDSLPLQHSLGLTWNLNTDSFVFTAPTFWESDIRLTSLNSESKFAKNPCEYPVTSHPSQYLLSMFFATASFH
jgi:hypothetical protein